MLSLLSLLSEIAPLESEEIFAGHTETVGKVLGHWQAGKMQKCDSLKNAFAAFERRILAVISAGKDVTSKKLKDTTAPAVAVVERGAWKDTLAATASWDDIQVAAAPLIVETYATSLTSTMTSLLEVQALFRKIDRLGKR